MNIEVQDDKKTLKTLPTVTSPGDKITLRAEMDCYVVFSSCPQDIVNIQGDEPFLKKNQIQKIIKLFKDDLEHKIDVASLMIKIDKETAKKSTNEFCTRAIGPG